MKDIKDYLKKEVAILCKTDEEAKKINELIAQNGGRSLYKEWQQRFKQSEEYHNGLEFGLDIPYNSYCHEGYYAKEMKYKVYPASDFLQSKHQMKEKDVKKDNFYYAEYKPGDFAIIKAERNGSLCGSGFRKEEYYKVNGWSCNENIREATKEERHHLECCIKENRFVPKEEALKSLNRFEAGRWYKVELNNKFNHFVKFKSVKNNTAYLDDLGYIADLRKWYHGTSIDLTDVTKLELLTDLSEIQKYLPSGHPDKLLKQETTTIPEYVECIKSEGSSFKKNIIYKIKNFVDNNFDIKYENQDEWYLNCPMKGDLFEFKPSTKEAYENQQLMNKHNLEERNLIGRYVKRISYDNYSSYKIVKIGEYDKIDREDGEWYYLSSFGCIEKKFIFSEFELMPIGFNPEVQEEKWIPKVGDWVVVEDNKSYSINGKLVGQISRFKSENDYWVNNGKNLSNDWRGDIELCCDGYPFRKCLPHEIPNNQPKVNDSNTQYWECKSSDTPSFTIGKIYKLNTGKTINDLGAFTDNQGFENGFGANGRNLSYFKPSTEAAYNAQNQIVKQSNTSFGYYSTYWVNKGTGYIQFDTTLQKPKTPKECYPATINIKNRTKKESLAKTVQKRTKLTILKPKSITI